MVIFLSSSAEGSDGRWTKDSVRFLMLRYMFYRFNKLTPMFLTDTGGREASGKNILWSILIKVDNFINSYKPIIQLVYIS